MRSAAALTLVALALAGALALLREGGSHASRAVPVASSLDGTFTISNSRAGSAIFTASDLAPGGSTAGTVTVGNGGTLPGTFALSQVDLQDVPGPGGGELSERVQLVVRDTATPATPVYSGPLAALDSRSLGFFGPGQSRTYSFTATLPDGDPAVDNAFAGSSASVRYLWTGESLPAGTPPPAADPPAADPAPGTDAPSAPEPAPCAPRIVLRAPEHQPAQRRGQLALRLRADGACRLSVWAWVEDPNGRRRYLRGRLGAALAAHRTRRLRLRIPAAPLRLLREARRHGRPAQVQVLVIAWGSSGKPTTLELVVPVQV